MANPALKSGALLKPVRGSLILDRASRKAEREKNEREAIAEAKRLDSYKCRWPEKHVCRGGLEGAHIVDKSLQGANDPDNIITLCAFLHRRGPESIHGKQLKVERESAEPGNRACSFYRQLPTFDALGQPEYECIAVEEQPFVIRRY